MANGQIVIPNKDKLIDSEVTFQGNRGKVITAEVIGKPESFKYLLTEIKFFKKNVDGINSVKVASLLFGEDDLFRYDELMASGEQHTCNGESDSVLLYCSCCSFKYDEDDSSKIIGCKCCQFGRCQHTVTTDPEPPVIGGRKNPILNSIVMQNFEGILKI
ncbi:hypothetical protein [Algoriphagus yeomjeoni]|nr:hypothetical protein [Algoriphagus yeomjeoni]